MTVTELVTELEEIGCTIRLKDGRPSVSAPANPQFHRRFHSLLQSLRTYSEDVLAHLQGIKLERCALCRRDVTDPEDKERLAGVNPFCDRGTVPAFWRDGRMLAKKIDGCPYRTM